MQSREVSCYFGKISLLINSFYMVKVMGVPPVLIDRVAKGTAHHRTAALFGVNHWIL